MNMVSDICPVLGRERGQVKKKAVNKFWTLSSRFVYCKDISEAILLGILQDWASYQTYLCDCDLK